MDSSDSHMGYQHGLSRNVGLVGQLKEWQARPRSLVFVALAESYRKEGLATEALEIIAEGLEFHPKLGSALFVRAKCLFDLRRYGEALKEIRELLQANPGNVKAKALEAELYIRLGQRKSALRVLRQLCAEYPQEKEWQESLKSLQSLRENEWQPVPSEGAKTIFIPSAPAPVGEIADFQVGGAAELSRLWAVDGPWNQPIATIGSFDSQPAEVSSEPPLVAELLPPPALVEGLGAVAAPVWDRADEEGALVQNGIDEPTIATRTIAELYLRQGFRARAIAVMQKILHDDPSHKWARETLQALHSDEILPKPKVNPKQRLAAKAQLLERMLLQIRLQKSAQA
jgi:tetratricopeptide (TPR) repeat protein